jgi:hypothetical protein
VAIGPADLEEDPMEYRREETTVLLLAAGMVTAAVS